MRRSKAVSQIAASWKSGKGRVCKIGQGKPEYRISKHVREDLIAIAHCGDERYGIQASDAYRDKLIRRFEALAEKPLRYPPVDHIRKGYRRSVCGVNSIYFRVEGDDIEIMRILGHQNLNAALTDQRCVFSTMDFRGTASIRDKSDTY